MWFESQQQITNQNCVMMGVQATTTTTATAAKRKFEAATAPTSHHLSHRGDGTTLPAKSGRWEAEDCIARLQAVAVPADMWRTPTNNMSAATSITTTATPTTTTISMHQDDFEDEDEFEDDLSDEDRVLPEQAKYYNNNNNNNIAASRYQPTAHQHQHNHVSSTSDYWNYYQPPTQLPPQPQSPVVQQQTIRCAENGKSYLELGATPTKAAITTTIPRCCDGRTRWCHVPCYRQRRLAVLNLSMCKLARYRQCSDPSLRRSVLICNTLRRLEREMELEPPPPPPPPPPPQPTVDTSPPSAYQSSSSSTTIDGGVVTTLPPMISRLNIVPPPHQPPSSADSLITYEQSLRDVSASGRVTPFPHHHHMTMTSDTDSGLGDEDMLMASRPINWSSVLSLASQSADLESLNNNDEFYSELGLSSNHSASSTSSMMTAHEEWKSEQRENEWDGFMHVLVGGS